MIERVLLPQLAKTMHEAMIALWNVKVGEQVEAGQPLCEITTHKVTLEVTSPFSGVLRALLVNEGQSVKVGEPVAIIADADEKIPAILLSPPATSDSPTVSVTPGAGDLPVYAEDVPHIPLEAGMLSPGVKNATEEALQLATEYDISILPLDGSGVDGQVQVKDIREYLEATRDLRLTPLARQVCRARNVDLRFFLGNTEEKITAEMAEAAPSCSGGIPQRMSLMRTIIAKRMALSTRNAPHFYITTAIDMGEALDYRKRLKGEKIRVSVNDMIIKACALALRKFPRMASVYTPAGYVERDRMHVGFAVAVGEDGLVVPVVRDADRKPLSALAEDTRSLIEKARNKQLTTDDYTGGVFSVSNLGTFEVDQFTAIINPGEAAILAVGKIADAPCVFNKELALRPVMKITLSSDHRVLDGVLAAKFNGQVKMLLEKPELLA
jgi:pyruvate dehydrogenase E2 component (dihydrolipoamide acetyltransferase)